MSDQASTYPPIPTREIPAPVLELVQASQDEPIPRILLQQVGSARAARKVVLLAMIFAALGLLELAVLLRLPQTESLVVYADAPRTLLIEGK